MRTDLRQKGLTRLAQTGGENALGHLREEGAKIGEMLSLETRYDLLEEQLELLNTFAFRIHDVAVEIIASFIQRLRRIAITYDEQDTWPESEQKKYQNAESLIIEAISVLTQLRYLEPDRVFEELLELTLNDAAEIRKKAIEGLEALAKYELTVFYGNDEQRGIGPAPQKFIFDKIEQFGDGALKKYFSVVNTIANCLLSPTMETTSSTYNTVTWKSAPVPAGGDVADISRRTIEFLKRLYALADTVSEKMEVIATLDAATATHRTSAYGDDVRDMIANDTVEVLQFFEGLIANEDLPIIQKIEHESYWIFYRALTETVATAALAVERTIAGHAEYQIYKDLIGFEGIFGDWSELKESENRWRQEEEERKRKATEYARIITSENYEEWRQRILNFVLTESDDLATFPYFFQFLREFADNSPELALDLISTDSDRIQRFLIPLLRGLWTSDKKPEVRSIIGTWINEGRYLTQCTKLFLDNDDLDMELLGSLLSTAQKIGDTQVVNMLVSVSVSNYAEGKEFLLGGLLMPAIETLTSHSDTRWIWDTWFRRESKAVIQSLDESGIDQILENLLHVKKIDYHADAILSLIAERYPRKIFEYFTRRLKAEKKGEISGIFDGIPYELHKLKEPLSKNPEQAVEVIRSWYDGDYGMFIYRGARVLRIIFPDFSKPFESELLKLVRVSGETNIEFVLAILRNYEGEPFLHEVCKEIIGVVPEESSLVGEVAVVLMNTGVVMGEFGLAEAYERKIDQVRDWLTDPDEKVQSFAKQYIEDLKKMSAAERRRSEEEIELRKHQFGE